MCQLYNYGLRGLALTLPARRGILGISSDCLGSLWYQLFVEQYLVLAQRHGHKEGCSFALLTFQPDAAMVGVDEILG